MKITVKNKNGTTNRHVPSNAKSWLDFWEKEMGHKSINCCVLDCTANAEVGGHVYIKDLTPKEYIIPLCKSCNNRPDGDEMIVENYNLVLINP